MKIIYIRGDLADISAKTKQLKALTHVQWRPSLRRRLRSRGRELPPALCIVSQLTGVGSPDYRITSKYSNALQTLQTCSFAN